MEEKMALLQGRNQKILSFEAMRLFAIFFVIFTHTEYDGYFLYSQYPAGSAPFWGYMIPSVFCSFAVPLFFSVSGALMLNRKEEPLALLWKKRVIKYSVLLVMVCFFYYMQYNDFASEEINLKEFIIILYAYSIGTITWFMYAYLAYLITLPFLRSMVQNLKTEHFHYLFGLMILFQTIVPLAEYFIWQGDVELNSSFGIQWLIETAVFYPMLGYYLEHRMVHKNRKRTLLFLWGLEILVLAAACATSYYVGQVEGGYVEGVASQFNRSFCPYTCVTVFLSIKYGMEEVRLPAWLEKGILCGGKCTFGIYIFHMHILHTDSSAAVQHAILRTNMDPMAASMVFCLYVMAVCWAATWVLKKVPLLKTFL